MIVWSIPTFTRYSSKAFCHVHSPTEVSHSRFCVQILLPATLCHTTLQTSYCLPHYVPHYMTDIVLSATLCATLHYRHRTACHIMCQTTLQTSCHYKALRLLLSVSCISVLKKQEVRIHKHFVVGTLAQTASSRQLLAVQSGQIKLAVTLRRAKKG
jgi:hypothetical protein